MRVAFFTQGTSVPAARYRVDQIVPALRAHVECDVLPATPSVYGDTAGLTNGWRALTKPLSLVSRLRQLSAIREADVVWAQRPMTEYYTVVFERYAARRRPLVFDFDDAIFHNRWGLEARKLRRIIDASARVVVGNAYLAEFVGQPDSTTIIPTVIDDMRFVPGPPPEGPFTIVWTGMSHNAREIVPLIPTLQRVLEATGGRLVLITLTVPRELEALPHELVTWTPENEASALGVGHVGIMPLRDTPYNRGKCAFKLIQYMGCGLPVVSSPVGANVEVVRDGVDGLHAETPAQWEEALIALARDPALRRRLGQAGRERVESAYSVRAVLPKYLDVLRAVT